MTGWSPRPLLIAALIVLSFVLFGVGGRAAIAQAAGGSATNEVIVQFAAGTSKAAMKALASGSGVEVERSVAPATGMAVSFTVYSSASLSVQQLVERFQDRPGVVAVSPNYVRSIALWPNDPRLGELWGLENTGQTGGTADADIDAAAAWEAGQGSGVVVACLDTGVDYDHADLAANMWRNPGEIAGDGIDNDGNGYIDDVYGIDTYSADSDPMDEHGHGTHTSGTMAAVGDNGVGVAGVAWQAKVMALRFLGPGGDGTDDGAIACINYAVDMKLNHGVNIAVINASWGGGDFDQVLANAIDAAGSAGIVFCAAAGNSGLNNDSQAFYPASYSSANVIAVGSSTSADARSSFSNYGAAGVDLFAPGTAILSTYQGRYAWLNGTSMAAPHVAGTVALLAALHPSDPVATRINRVLLSVDRISAFSGYCVTGGRLNAGSAMATGTPTVTSVTPNSGPAGGDASVVIRGSGFVGLSGASAVTFGGTPATAYTVNSTTQITATTPVHSAGTFSVRVVCPFGTSPDTTSDDYTFIPAPAIIGVNPASGPSAGGTEVLIDGSGFVGLSDASAVTFGGIAAARLTVISDTQLSVTTPSGTAGPVRVQVVAAGGTTPEALAATFTYTSPPRIHYEDSNDRIAYTGSWASFPTASASASAYSRANTSRSSAVLTFVGDKLDWIAMKGTTTGKADVYLDDVFKSTVDLAAAAATYQVDVWNTGLLPYGSHEVRIEWNSANAAGKYITLDGVEVLGDLVYRVPSITSLSPASGSTIGGASVVISGTGFNGVTSVLFGSDPAATFTVDSATKITATAPAHAAGSVRVQVTAAGGKTAAELSDEFTYAVAPPVIRTDAALINAAFVLAGTWGAYSTASAYGGSYLRASTSGASFMIPFNGTQLDWIATKGLTTGTADVYLDDVFKTAVDLSAMAVSYQANVWSTGILAPGYHTVKIVRSASNASGKYITVDAVNVAGTLLTPARKEESEPLILWNPAFTSWTTGPSSSASGGSYKYVNTAGARITIAFTGVSLDLIARKAPSYGKMRVTVDGGTSHTVDLYASASAYKRTVWQSGFLAPGDHTVSITRLGTKNAYSSGYTIDLDAIDLIGELK